MKGAGPASLSPASRRRLLLLALSGAAAFALGFVFVTPRQTEELLIRGGYYYMLGLFSLFVWFALRVARGRREVWRGWLRRPGWPGLVLAAASLFLVWSDRFQHKVLFDEYVLQGTAYEMHLTKEVGTLVRAYRLDGSWLPLGTFLDKRPFFFTFLLSLVHDLSGYRIANVFFLNAALAAAFLALTYWFAAQLAGRAGGFFAVALLATLPLLGQNATGAGMETHNLTMLMLVMCLGLLYLRVPGPDRLALFCLGTVLLAESRYESVIFVGPAAAVIVAGWVRARRILLPWPALLAPLLLVPYAWHTRFVDAVPEHWQLRAGETSRFSLAYLGGNLTSACRFFFSFTGAMADSWYLSAVGCAGLGWLAWRGVRRLREREPLAPAEFVTLVFGAGIGANFALLMFYYWSHLDEPVAARFALPACLLFALAAVLLARHFDSRWPATRAALLGTGVFLLGWALPAMGHRFYTSENLVEQEVQWEERVVASLPPGPKLVVSNKSSIPWMLRQIPSVIEDLARQRGPQIRYHLQQGTFQQVIVSQALRPTSAEGGFAVDPADLLPSSFHLRTIAEKRFGIRLARLSLLVAIDPAPGGPSAGPVTQAPARAAHPAL